MLKFFDGQTDWRTDGQSDYYRAPAYLGGALMNVYFHIPSMNLNASLHNLISSVFEQDVQVSQKTSSKILYQHIYVLNTYINLHFLIPKLHNIAHT